MTIVPVRRRRWVRLRRHSEIRTDRAGLIPKYGSIQPVPGSPVKLTELIPADALVHRRRRRAGVFLLFRSAAAFEAAVIFAGTRRRFILPALALGVAAFTAIVIIIRFVVVAGGSVKLGRVNYLGQFAHFLNGLHQHGWLAVASHRGPFGY
ncbi:unnamed protein product [Cuscuta campestris]|uniref:Uncharacterized protein n=1 Tax=Cuscuta campestris TaxID=132261 RepID=A0A484LLH1_9ASTE|nr:unnamed protein product [Cuscuta campestris]